LPVNDTATNQAGSGEREVQSVARALHILEAVSAAAEPGVTEIARTVGLHVATAHNLLRTLSNHGYLENRNGRYRLGAALAKLVGPGDHAGALPEYLQTWVERLSRETGEAASASVLEDGLARIVAFQPGTHALTIHFPRRLWPNPLALATGRLLVAELPEGDWSAFLPGEDKPADRDWWTVRLRGIRQEGFSILRHPEQVAIAFPVRNRSGRVLCAIGASTPASRALPDHCAAVFTAIRRAADELSQEFGCPTTLLARTAAATPPDWATVES
jgi:DNA-binding IclR family transcriptional regulator